MTTDVEIRCPVGFQRLFLKLRKSGEKPVYVHPENLLEIACGDCARSARRSGQDVKQVLHYFNLIGECVKTTKIF